MMFHLRVAQTTILATGSALALMTATLGDHAHAEGKLDASYTISFAHIRVGDIAATGIFGESEYAISARGDEGITSNITCTCPLIRSVSAGGDPRYGT